MNFNHLKKIILKLKNKSLPGMDSHIPLVPTERINVIRNINDVKNYKIASVAVLLYPDINNITRLVLIKRSNYTGTHSGQIAFPGGKYEKSDKSYEETSRRETFEEIGVSKSLYNKITNLSKIYIPPSNYMVYPYLFVSNSNLSFTLDKREVNSIILPSVDEILNFEVQLGKFEENINPYFHYDNNKIWGATAMILNEFIHLMTNKK